MKGLTVLGPVGRSTRAFFNVVLSVLRVNLRHNRTMTVRRFLWFLRSLFINNGLDLRVHGVLHCVPRKMKNYNRSFPRFFLWGTALVCRLRVVWGRPLFLSENTVQQRQAKNGSTGVHVITAKNGMRIKR